MLGAEGLSRARYGQAPFPPILADQLNLFQPGLTDYAHLIITGKPGFSDLPMALIFRLVRKSNLIKTKAAIYILSKIELIRFRFFI